MVIQSRLRQKLTLLAMRQLWSASGNASVILNLPTASRYCCLQAKRKGLTYETYPGVHGCSHNWLSRLSNSWVSVLVMKLTRMSAVHGDVICAQLST